MSELKPCPFCGGKAKLIISDEENADTTQWHRIMCEDVFGCGASMSTTISGWSLNYEERVIEFIDRWNRRANNGV